MPQVYECEEWGKVIQDNENWVEVDTPSDDPNVIAVFQCRVHADPDFDCLEKFRRKHPR